MLDQALWQRLAEAESLPEAAAAYLALQIGLLPTVSRGAVVVTEENGSRQLAAAWPDGVPPTTALTSAIAMAAEQRRGIVQRPEAVQNDSDAVADASLAFPIVLDGTVESVVAIELSAVRGSEIRTAMRQLQWGTAWIRERLRQRAEGRARRSLQRVTTAQDMLAAALEEEGFAAACRAATTEIALATQCDRVSVGFVRRGHSRVAAISHSAEFGKRMNLVAMLGEAMDEAIDQRAIIIHPAPPDDPLITRAHAELAHAHNARNVLTTPLFVRDQFIGAFTFERAKDRTFDPDTVAMLDFVAATLAPVLAEKRDNDRWLVVKAGDVFLTQLRRLLGPGHFTRKLVALTAAAAVLFCYFAEGSYRVIADARIEGKVQRALVAPFAGFVKEAPVRAGDAVTEGTVLAALDDRELALERLRWVTERQQRLYEYDRALGERSRADRKIIKAQIDQAEAQMHLIDEQLGRAKLYAPFDGLVVSGDLSQSIGAAVERGEVLFEVAPLAAYRVILQVDESQISHITIGQDGDLLVASLPNETFPITVEKITPVASAQDGRNMFKVEAALQSVEPQLRPGMEGIGKVDVGERRLVWIWSRTLMDWLRVTAWRWFG